MTTKIIGTGSYTPEWVVSNDNLVRVMETSDEQVQLKTGIRERRVTDCERTSELTAETAVAVMENAGVEANETDIIILVTPSLDNCLPNEACEVQAAIRAESTVISSISAICTGFVYALNTMHAFPKSSLCQTRLVTGAGVMSESTDRTDRGTCALFGDGVGATVVRAEESGIARMAMKADGKKSHVLTCKARASENFSTGGTPELGCTAMDDQEAFKPAVERIPECVRQVLEENRTDTEEIEYSVMRQANYRVFESIAKRLKVSMERIFMDVDRYGNTSGTSVPITLDKLSRGGKLQPGNKLILPGFDAGLTWGATLTEW